MNLTKTHRELYPEQYTHKLVGKSVKVAGTKISGRVTRVVPSRFGPLAILNDNAKKAYSVGRCKEVS